MNKHILTLNGLSATAYTPATHDAAAPLLLTFFTAAEADKLAALLPEGMVLLAINEPNWEHAFTPWPAARAFKGTPDFGGGADAFLHDLLNSILPTAEAALALQPAWRGLTGYSLAGLFALYAAYRCDVFTRIASVSGSLWYDGWLDFMQARTPQHLPERAYFSVGDKEKNAKNPRLARVEAHTQEAAAIWCKLGATTMFELTEGGHFNDAPQRLAKAIRWLSQTDATPFDSRQV